MKRPKYADTLEKIANQSADVFYTGDLAKTIAKEVQGRGGIITEEDLAEYQADSEEALSVSLNDSLTAFTTHAPSSGPILMFILNILRGILWKFSFEDSIRFLGYKVNAADLNDTTTASLFYHRLIESFKFAYAKRSELGDPDKVNITDVCNEGNSLLKEYRNSCFSLFEI